jgi:hypothetical protein
MSSLMRLIARWMVVGYLLAGCATLTAGGERVQATDMPSENSRGPDVSGCRSLGPVKVHAQSTQPGSPLTGNFAIARSNARIDLRNKAAEAGADTLVNVKTDDDFWGVTATGDAYDCGKGKQ